MCFDSGDAEFCAITLKAKWFCVQGLSEWLRDKVITMACHWDLARTGPA